MIQFWASLLLVVAALQAAAAQTEASDTTLPVLSRRNLAAVGAGAGASNVWRGGADLIRGSQSTTLSKKCCDFVLLQARPSTKCARRVRLESETSEIYRSLSYEIRRPNSLRERERALPRRQSCAGQAPRCRLCARLRPGRILGAGAGAGACPTNARVPPGRLTDLRAAALWRSPVRVHLERVKPGRFRHRDAVRASRRRRGGPPGRAAYVVPASRLPWAAGASASWHGTSAGSPAAQLKRVCRDLLFGDPASPAYGPYRILLVDSWKTVLTKVRGARARHR